MIEVLVLLTLFGLIFSSFPQFGLGNPFQIYFAVWFLVFTGYCFTQSTWIRPSSDFFFALIVINSVWMACFVLLGPSMVRANLNRRIVMPAINCKFVMTAEIICIVALPFLYSRLMQLSDGKSIFSVAGYTAVRASSTEDAGSMGILGYILVLSLVTSSVSTFLFKAGQIRLSMVILCWLVALFYSYVSTGRTYFLLFFVLHLFPLIVTKQIAVKGLVVAIALLIVSFGLVATLTSKGVSTDADTSTNIYSGVENLRGYTIAPLVAFSKLYDNTHRFTLGDNTFRFCFSLLYAMGLTDNPPVPLVREYENVPDLTNVYTVYDVYYLDFGNLGFCVVFVFVALHVFLYQQMLKRGGIFVFLYSASLFALIMQFFQDEYFSLLSTWIQISVWYSLFIRSNRQYLPGTKRLAQTVNTSRGHSSRVRTNAATT